MHLAMRNLQEDCAVLRATSVVSSSTAAVKDLILHLDSAMGDDRHSADE